METCIRIPHPFWEVVETRTCKVGIFHTLVVGICLLLEEVVETCTRISVVLACGV